MSVVWLSIGDGKYFSSSLFHDRILNTILELDGIDSDWKEIELPVKKLRFGHHAFAATQDNLKIFCGKRKIISSIIIRSPN